MPVPILILAAGASTRMRGADKLLMEIDAVPLLRRIAGQAAAVGPTFVALPGHAPARLAALDGLAVTPLPIPAAADGQAATLRDGVALLPDCAAFLVVLADLPGLTAADLQAVIAARTEHPQALIWRGATPDRQPGHPILFDASLRPRFADLQGDDGGTAVVKPLRDRTILVPFADDRALFDLDTPEAWAAFRAARAGSGHQDA